MSVGTPFEYRIPSLPVIIVILRHMRFEVEEEDDKVVQYDCIIKQDPSLDHQVPRVVVVSESCFVDVS